MRWHKTKDDARVEAFILSQLQHTQDWIGSLIHRGIASDFIPSFKKTNRITEDDLTKHIIDLSKQQFEFSKQKLYRSQTKSSSGDSFCALYFHEYDISNDESSLLSEADTQIKNAIHNLYLQEELIHIFEESNWLNSEVILTWNFSDYATVFGQIDVVGFMKDRKPVVVDWKTGDLSSVTRNQMALYLKLVLNKWEKFNADDVTVLEVNLKHGKIIRHFFDDSDMSKVDDFVYASINDIKAIAQNQRYAEQKKRLGYYSFANSPNSCLYCKFRKLCEDLLE